MTQNKPKTTLGFSLMELLISLAIIGILATLSYPSYQKYIIRSHRFEGQSALLALACRMETYYTQHGTYSTATIGTGKATDVLCKSLSAQNGYVLSIIKATDKTYLLKAAPTTPDKNCQSLTLSSSGAKGITATSMGSIEQCW